MTISARSGEFDPRLSKPRHDGVMQIAAHGEALFHIGDNAAQFEFQPDIPETQQECSRRR